VVETKQQLATEQQHGAELAKQCNEQDRTIATTSAKLESVTEQLKEAKQAITDKESQAAAIREKAEADAAAHNEKATKLESDLKASQAEVKQVNAELGRANQRADKLEANLMALTENLQKPPVMPENESEEDQLSLLEGKEKE
ncbi:hypothetical protein P3733_24520, partial [Vibrio parahaemolyticus]|nr:hypothetical protein [Vibrio parahaemolyticus]